MKIKFFLFFLFPSILFSQSNYSDFFKLLIGNDFLQGYVDEAELVRSNRLGINYIDVKNKFLIAYDIDESVKNEIIKEKLSYDIVVPTVTDEFASIEFSVPSLKYKKQFYFRNFKYIAPSTYFTRNWQIKESKYFRFKISEPKYFNDYCMRRLDEFADMVADTLKLSFIEKAILEKQKIDYIFCKDESEVQQLTGYRSKGQYVLAFDEIITAYQTHFHEVAHLLMNFKLKNPGLYTLPFFMEGFAVSMGGRGGMAPRVVTDVGYYLQKTGFLTYDSILTYDAFMSQDANMTYSVAGVYNAFLIKELGIFDYLDLYKKANGNLKYIEGIKGKELDLPSLEKFESFLKLYNNQKQISFDRESIEKDTCEMYEAGDLNGFCEVNEKYRFHLYSNINFSDTGIIGGYYSKTAGELYPSSNHEVFQYLVIPSSENIRVFDLFNDELIASYDKNFSLKGDAIPQAEAKKGKQYLFFISKYLFDLKNDNIFITGFKDR